MRLYINQEFWSNGHVSRVIFTNKKSAIANAKRWIGEIIENGEKTKIEQINTWRTIDDCGLGIYDTKIKKLELNAEIINTEYDK